MRFRHLFLTLLLALQAQPAEPNFFIQMSDPQFGMYAENKDFHQETINFEFAIATANRLRPKFVVICGDLVNEAGNAAQTAEFLRIAARGLPAQGTAILVQIAKANERAGNIDGLYDNYELATQAGLAIATQATAQVTFYEHDGFGGRSFTTDKQIGN
jgi:Icc-related predicted phosphoesterase